MSSSSTAGPAAGSKGAERGQFDRYWTRSSDAGAALWFRLLTVGAILLWVVVCRVVGHVGTTVVVVGGLAFTVAVQLVASRFDDRRR